MGYGLHQLALKGHRKNSYAVDIVNHWDLGHELLRQKKLHIEYIESNVLSPLDKLLLSRGSIDLTSIMDVLYQRDPKTQLAAVIRLSLLTECSGSLVIEFQDEGVKPKAGEVAGFKCHSELQNVGILEENVVINW
ncbi:hypothetical protein MFRU_008g00070 [Monilinia fructicola]|nr:hypothetical protein MFRU_008g00070 [Monilinia fructicola]